MNLFQDEKSDRKWEAVESDYFFSLLLRMLLLLFIGNMFNISIDAGCVDKLQVLEEMKYLEKKLHKA
jgi:hypothetical protein